MGLCGTHYNRQRKYGHPEASEPFGRGGPQRKDKAPKEERLKQTPGPVNGHSQRGEGGRFVRGNTIGYKPGESGNPGGIITNGVTHREILRLAREQSPANIATLARIRDDDSQPGMVRVRAAEVLLDRAWGRPILPVASEFGEPDDACNNPDGSISALLLAARLHPRESKTIDGVAVPLDEPDEATAAEAVRVAKAVTDALANGVPKEEVARIIAASLRRPEPPRPAPSPALDLAPEPSPAPHSEPQTAEAIEVAPSAPTEPKAAPAPAKPSNIPGFDEFRAQRQADRERQRSNGTIKLV